VFVFVCHCALMLMQKCMHVQLEHMNACMHVYMHISSFLLFFFCLLFSLPSAQTIDTGELGGLIKNSLEAAMLVSILAVLVRLELVVACTSCLCTFDTFSVFFPRPLHFHYHLASPHVH